MRAACRWSVRETVPSGGGSILVRWTSADMARGLHLGVVDISRHGIQTSAAWRGGSSVGHQQTWRGGLGVVDISSGEGAPSWCGRHQQTWRGGSVGMRDLSRHGEGAPGHIRHGVVDISRHGEGALSGCGTHQTWRGGSDLVWWTSAGMARGL